MDNKNLREARAGNAFDRDKIARMHRHVIISHIGGLPVAKIGSASVPASPAAHRSRSGSDEEFGGGFMAENPLLKALPPASDYLTYLTILEYNLTADQLPTLHTILQDTTLTANIGWDLVHLLLPLLPASRQCLLDVARLGNPREVVLKVTEILEGFKVDGAGKFPDIKEEDVDELGDISLAENEDIELSKEQVVSPPLQTTSPKRSSKHSHKPQFIILLEMLSILHPRIKTKYPSRFLSTSLREILSVYLNLAANIEATDAVLSFIKAVSGRGRPKLPPRKSTTVIPVHEASKIAPDPEGQEDSSAPEESDLHNRLLQSFLTFVIDDFVSSVPSDGEIAGMAWSCRLQEKWFPDKVIQGRVTYEETFANKEELHERDVVVGRIVALARDLKITPEELLSVVTEPEVESSATSSELPSSAAEVQLSRTGSLLLLSAFTAASSLFDVKTTMPPMSIFPEYAAILENFIGDESMNGIGLERPSFVDAVIFLGLFIADTPAYTPPEEDQKFTQVLQRLSLLSANTPSAALRFNAHLLTTKILHSHPSHDTRLAFIQDTLQYCPYENLKTSAVGWLKDELLSADRNENIKTPTTNPPSPFPSPFKSPSTLSTLSSLLFLNPHNLISSSSYSSSSSPSKDYSSFHAHYSFYLAVLNLLYLLLTSPSLFISLDIKSLIPNADIRTGFLNPLKQVSAELQVSADRQGRREEGEGEGEEKGGGMLQHEHEHEHEHEENEGIAMEMEMETQMEIALLTANLEMVEIAMKDKGL